ncbi:DeoR/GlpR family DNA-binding transcription regulator [Kineococcus gynurae]
MADHPDAKARIAARAAGYVRDGQTVVLNGGTTTLAVVNHLTDRRDLTIVTNNLMIPPALPEGVARGVYVVGGSTRMRSLATVGRLRFPDAQGRTSLAVSADLAIVGVSTVSLDGVFGVSNLREAQLLREMVDAGRTVVVLADSSKLDRTGFAHVCTAKEIDVFITDAVLPRPLTTAFARAGVQVVLAR